jgi:hypothetical protein
MRSRTIHLKACFGPGFQKMNVISTVTDQRSGCDLPIKSSARRLAFVTVKKKTFLM